MITPAIKNNSTRAILTLTSGAAFMKRETASWMKKLASHYEKMRNLYPDDKLIILFDIDGTILDMRYMILYVLRLFDRKNNTSYFERLNISDITVHENQVKTLLTQLEIADSQIEQIHNWYLRERWSRAAMVESHRPFRGVMEVIRWFQIQPNTYVGLNTGRPESIRSETLTTLNELGREYKAVFTNELLYMNPLDWETNIKDSKAAGVIHLQKAGYRIFAFVDNEPLNLRAVSEVDTNREILLLHADTIFESKRVQLPAVTVSGRAYDITELIDEHLLPRHVQFVWHGVNDRANLRQFIASNIQWCECDLRLDARRDSIILRHDSMETHPSGENENCLFVEEVLEHIKRADGKSIKLDLKENGILIEKIIVVLEKYRLDDSRLWFNGNVEVHRESGFRRLSAVFPGSIIQCPVDFMHPLILSLPDKARDLLNTFSSWGINRFSLSWKTPHLQQLLEQMDEWGFRVNVYNVPDLEAFLKVVLLQPESITSDFNFPEWHYYGRGSGENLRYHKYSIMPYQQSTFSSV